MTEKRIWNLLRISTFLVLVSRALLFIFWEDQGMVVFSTSAAAKGIIGSVLLLTSIICFFPRKAFENVLLRSALALAGCILVIHSVGLMIHKGFLIEEFVEHSLQFGLPFFLLFHTSKSLSVNNDRLRIGLDALLALTFIGHGVFAVGMNIVPDSFMTLTTQTFYCNDEAAASFLFIMGILDFVAAVFLFFPAFRKSALLYMIFWGTITAVARMYSPALFVPFEVTLTEHFLNMTLRLAHGLIPFALLLNWQTARQTILKGSHFFAKQQHSV